MLSNKHATILRDLAIRCLIFDADGRVIGAPADFDHDEIEAALDALDGMFTKVESEHATPEQSERLPDGWTWSDDHDEVTAIGPTFTADYCTEENRSVWIDGDGDLNLERGRDWEPRAVVRAVIARHDRLARETGESAAADPELENRIFDTHLTSIQCSGPVVWHPNGAVKPANTPPKRVRVCTIDNPVSAVVVFSNIVRHTMSGSELSVMSLGEEMTLPGGACIVRTADGWTLWREETDQ